MGYNLYSLTENQLLDLCKEKLFDRKSTEIVIKKIIYDEDAKPFKVAKYFL
jgi:hypothetical protein